MRELKKEYDEGIRRNAVKVVMVGLSAVGVVIAAFGIWHIRMLSY